MNNNNSRILLISMKATDVCVVVEAPGKYSQPPHTARGSHQVQSRLAAAVSLIAVLGGWSSTLVIPSGTYLSVVYTTTRDGTDSRKHPVERISSPKYRKMRTPKDPPSLALLLFLCLLFHFVRFQSSFFRFILFLLFIIILFHFTFTFIFNFISFLSAF